MKELSWNFAELWNNALYRDERELVVRDYAWASELGRPIIDRWLKMRATPVTNPPNMRSLRKFEAGNLVEFVVRFVLQRAGILQDVQNEVWFGYDDTIKCKGKLDFLAGGHPDPIKAKADISSLHLPPSIEQSSMNIVDKLVEMYGETPLKMLVLEIKSCSVFVMNALEKTQKPLTGHKLQLFHYIKGLNMDEGHLCYISKDDLRMATFGIWNPSSTEDEYRKDLLAITEAMKSDERPPLEPLILWNEDLAKFSKNLGVEYSSYLTMLYGYERPDIYSDEQKPIVDRWNRVIKRYACNDKITDKNKEVKDEITTAGYDFDKLVSVKEQKLDLDDEQE
jgi:hypothetical protein